jgi:tetratricopeptide (TPR) repeat protein
MADKFRVFLSAVSSECGAARQEIASDLRARGIEVKEQRDFRQEHDTSTTLAKLNKYIRESDAVTRSGAFTMPEEAAPFLCVLPKGLARASYTQFEFHFAQHYGKRLSIYIANECFSPDRDAPSSSDDDPAGQSIHRTKLERLDRSYFDTTHHLCRLMLREDWPVLVARQPNNMPIPSLGSLFKGREDVLFTLRERFQDGTSATALVGRALHGLGGVGKTRLAIEYAHRFWYQYSAVLFVRAGNASQLNSELAALAGPDVLDLPEKDAPQEDVKMAAVRNWLEQNPTWLMLLDNVDDVDARAAVSGLLATLRGGHVLITGRVSNFPASVRTVELGALSVEDATDFLLARADGTRSAAADDAAQARTLATEMGGLALGLEQEGAYIATKRIGFDGYLSLWRDNRAKVVDWFDRSLMSYEHDTGLAATWATSVAHLSADGRALLDVIAFLAPEPVPDLMLDVPIQGMTIDLEQGRADLLAYFMVAATLFEDGRTKAEGFAVHRLVQDFTCRLMDGEHRAVAARAALGWVNEGFAGVPGDVRSWPRLDPLVAHVQALIDDAGTPDQDGTVAHLCGQLGFLFWSKARYADGIALERRALAADEARLGMDHPTVATRLSNLAASLQATNRLAEAEPMYRRALAIGKASLGPDHPNVARGLNNLALLLGATNRLAEAEPLHRPALAIDQPSLGPDHPNVARGLNNLALLLGATNRLAEAEPLYRRALAIDEASLGPDHPNVARGLNNLAELLDATNRLAEAEPMYRRALAIDEASLGPDHPNVATGLNNLTELLGATNRLAEADPMYRRALAIMEASLGPNHPSTVTVRGNLERALDELK